MDSPETEVIRIEQPDTTDAVLQYTEIKFSSTRMMGSILD
jgi:hypothetical protein